MHLCSNNYVGSGYFKSIYEFVGKFLHVNIPVFVVHTSQDGLFQFATDSFRLKRLQCNNDRPWRS